MNKGIKQKLIKLLKIKNEGAGNEADNAEAILLSLLKKHNIDLSEIENHDHTKTDFHVGYKSKLQKDLILQLTAMVTNSTTFNVYRYPRKKTVILSLTKSQQAEFIVRWDMLKKALEKEMNTLFHAFVIKHKLWATADPNSSLPPMDKDTLRAMEMSKNLSDVDITKRIGSGI